MSRIVVGVDGSEHAVRALRWAADEARLRKADLEIVHAHPQRDMPAYPNIRPRSSDEELQGAGLELIDTLVDDVDLGGLEVERTAVGGNAPRRLCQAAEGADLLVVGPRGLGGFRGLLLGSVAQQVVAHSPCPVVVVVPEQR